ENGPFYSVNATRSYKQGEEWKETTSFHQQDLLTLAKMLDQADTWIANEQAKAKAADQGHDAEQSGYAERETGPRAAAGRRREPGPTGGIQAAHRLHHGQEGVLLSHGQMRPAELSRPAHPQLHAGCPR